MVMVLDSKRLRRYRQVFAHLFPDPAGTRILLSDAGLSLARLTLEGAPEVRWHEILVEAERQECLEALVHLAFEQYPGNSELAALVYGVSPKSGHPDQSRQPAVPTLAATPTVQAPPPAVLMQPGVGVEFVVCAQGTAPYRTIGAALAAAPRGARVVVRPGDYHEHIKLQQSVELVADGQGVRLFGTGETLVKIDTEERVFIRGLALTMEAVKSGHVVVSVYSPQATLEDCTVISTGDGLCTFSGARTSTTLGMRRCQIKCDRGIQVDSKSALRLEDCLIASQCWGVTIHRGARVEGYHCTITGGSRNAIWVASADCTAFFQDCDLRGNAKGAWMIEPGATVHRARNQE